MSGTWQVAGMMVALALANGDGPARATPGSGNGSGRATPASDMVALRAGARAILQKHCMPCHSGSALPAPAGSP